jgi:hypothetical protein
MAAPTVREDFISFAGPYEALAEGPEGDLLRPARLRELRGHRAARPDRADLGQGVAQVLRCTAWVDRSPNVSCGTTAERS